MQDSVSPPLPPGPSITIGAPSGKLSRGSEESLARIRQLETELFALKEENGSNMSSVDEMQHEKAYRRAEQLMKGIGFDGLSDGDYVKWRYTVLSTIENSYVCNGSWTQYYAVMCSLSGSALTFARAMGLGSDPRSTVELLWSRLDSRYLSSNAIGAFEREFGNLRQSVGESMAEYAGRFMHLMEVRRSMYGGTPMGDLEARVRFSNGIRGDPNLQWVKAIAEELSSDFNGFCRTMISYSRNVPAPHPTATSFHLGAVGASAGTHATSRPQGRCFRCNGEGHFADKCQAASVYNEDKRCQRCGSSSHLIVACSVTASRCRRCMKTGHYAGVCRAKPDSVTLNSVEQAPHVSSVLTDDLNIERDMQNCTLSIQAMSSTVDESLANIVDTSPMDETFYVINEGRRCAIPGCLKDTGASASFIHEEVATYLIRAGMAQSVKPVALNVVYANGVKESVKTCVTLAGRFGTASPDSLVDVHFLVLPNCSPRVILGRPVLRQMVGAPLLHCSAVSDAKSNDVIPESPVAVSAVTIPDVITSLVTESVTSQTALVSTVAEFAATVPQVVMKPASVAAAPCVTPWIEFRPDGVYARCPFIESANVLPYRERDRNMSVVDRRICYARLMRMVQEHKVSIVEARECHVILAPVLVDKLEGTKASRVFLGTESVELHSRYRITVDCRPLNEMLLVAHNGVNLFMLPPADRKRKTAANQSQQSGRAVLESLPMGGPGSRYGKIDLSDAFSSVRVTEGIGRLLAVMVPDMDGNPVAFQWKCLPQGWRHSPFLFTTCINALLRPLDSALRGLATVRHFQDDIVVVGADDESVNGAMRLVITELKSKGFGIQEKKCIWSVDSITFCGYRLKSGSLLPDPKTPLTSKLAEDGWKNFSSSDSSECRIRWLREWAGRFQFWRDFFAPKTGIPSLQLFYDFLKEYASERPDVCVDKVSALKDAFFGLFELCVSSAPLGVGLCNALRNILLVDANSDSWGGILIKVVSNVDNAYTDMTLGMASCAGMEALSAAISDLKQALAASDIPEPYVLVPVKLCGAVFSERQRRCSSTHRERLAQLECFNQCYPWIDAPLIVVCDNMNCSLTWHNLDLFGARHLDMWERLQACLDTPGHLWLPRTSAPEFADSIARVVAADDLRSVRCAVAGVVETRDVRNAEDLHVDADLDLPVVIASDEFRRALVRGYRSDVESKYQGHRIVDIYKVLLSAAPATSEPLVRMCQHRFKVVDGVLFYKSMGADRCVVPNADSTHLLVDRPCNMRAGLLSAYHDRMLHPGVSRLYANLGRSWFWSGLSADCNRYVRSCEQCRVASSTHAKPAGEGKLGSLVSKAGMPWDHLMIDFAVVSGNQNVLLVIDCYSHWLFSFATEDQTALSVAKALKSLFMTIGFPTKIISDNGVHFVNEVIQQLSQVFGFVVFTGSPYHPSRQGLVERCVREIKLGLAKAPDLALATMLHNMSPLSYCSFSPYSIVYGREPRFSASPDFVPVGLHDLDQLRGAWDQCRTAHHESVNDRSMLRPSAQLSEGDRVIWRIEGNCFVKILASKAGVNHWNLTDGRTVPESQLELFNDLASDLRVMAPPLPFSPGDLVLFLREDCLDVGRLVSSSATDGKVEVVNLYMNDAGQWYEHGDQYTDHVAVESIVKKVRLTEDRKVDRRLL